MGYEFEFTQDNNNIPHGDAIKIWGDELTAFRKIIKGEATSADDVVLDEMVADFDSEKEKLTKYKYKDFSTTKIQ